MNNSRKIKDLKIKLANLELEVRSLLDAGKSESGIIDAIAADISDFTDEVMKVKKELRNMGVKIDESIKLNELYKNIKYINEIKVNNPSRRLLSDKEKSQLYKKYDDELGDPYYDGREYLGDGDDEFDEEIYKISLPNKKSYLVYASPVYGFKGEKWYELSGDIVNKKI
jgi:hypothetical protein